MPFYKITIGLKKGDLAGSRQTVSAIREYQETDLDRVWHMVHMKCEEKWGSKLNSFDCVRISKRSPDFIRFLKDKQQKKFDHYDDVLLPVNIPLENKSATETKQPQSVNGKYRNQKE